MIYVADFSLRTEGDRGVEVYTKKPLTPDETRAMDCLTLINDKQLKIEFSIFDDHQFKKEADECKDDSHCECCFFPSESDESSWISFVEIKDCKPKNIALYRDKAKQQIISTIDHFKKNGIISESKKMYGIISFPRRTKTDFNDYILGSHQDILEMRRKHGVLFLATNTVSIISKALVL